MVGWHHRLVEYEFEQASGVRDGQGSLVCYSPWGHQESDTTERLNWTSGQLRECKPHTLPLQSRPESLLLVWLKALHSGNSNRSRSLSQDFYSPNYRAMIENMPPNQCRCLLQGSYPKALLVVSKQFSKPQQYIVNYVTQRNIHAAMGLVRDITSSDWKHTSPKAFPEGK